MSTRKPSDEPTPEGEPPRVASSPVQVVLTGLALFTLTRIVAVVLESKSMASGVLQAVITEFGASRLGVTWSDPSAEEPKAAALARRAAIGASFGFGAAAVVVILLAITNGASFARLGNDGVPTALLLVGLIEAGLVAIRDELLLHGVPLHLLALLATAGNELAKRPLVQVLTCGVTSAAFALSMPGAVHAVTVLVQLLLGIGLGALWVEDRGAWKAWGAQAAWAFATTTLLRGGLLEVRTAHSAWAGGEEGPLAGLAALVALAPFAVMALRPRALVR